MKHSSKTSARVIAAILLLTTAPTVQSQQGPGLESAALVTFREELRVRLPALHPTPVLEDGGLIGFRINTIVHAYLTLGLHEGDVVVLPGAPIPTSTLQERDISDLLEVLFDPGNTWRIRSPDGRLREISYRQPDFCPGVPAERIESEGILFC